MPVATVKGYVRGVEEDTHKKPLEITSPGITGDSLGCLTGGVLSAKAHLKTVAITKGYITSVAKTVKGFIGNSPIII